MKTRKPSSVKYLTLWQRCVTPLIKPFAILLLLVAWWVGYSQQVGINHVLARYLNVVTVTKIDGQEHQFTYSGVTGSVTTYAASANGYGGPLVMAFEIDNNQRIRNAILVDHIDTAGYVVNVLNQRFLDRINGKTISDTLRNGFDIDGVSGATLTVEGMTEAVRKAAHEAALQRGLSPKVEATPWRFQWTDALLTLLVLMVLFERQMPATLRKYHIMFVGALSVVVIGFWANMALSIASLSSLILGYWPDPRQNPSLYILLLSVLVGIVWLGKNLYCSQLCPFHHIQRWLHKLGKNNIALSCWINNHAITVVNVLLWSALMLIFITRNPAVASYEPFSMLFSLDGVGVQWYLLPLALFGSFFIKDYWCRLFCPLGRGLNLLVEKRQQTRQWLRSRAKRKVIQVQSAKSQATLQQSNIERDK
ncbi:FMN-binding protein [Vibrio scophthalmi]|uniref:FMN-binding protein n=1 Tax=Vibrio scophthalmi TaxID=45658 RepID=UPI0011106A53|nr:FMN-binding protein [Vibrio scophthalmi]